MTQVKDKVSLLKSNGKEPKLAVILVGEDPASAVYVRKKEESCREAGIAFEHHIKPASTTQEELENTIQDLNLRDDITGILLQLPLANHLDKAKAINLIHPLKDVDGLTALNAGKTAIGAEDAIIPATPLGVLRILRHAEVSLEGKNTVVIGASQLVGQPMALLLTQQKATVTLCHKQTKNLNAHLKQAELIISATGCPLLVTGEHIQQGAVIVDIGISPNIDPEASCKIMGDVCDSVEGIASLITPVPGGVGPMTVISLLTNILDATRLQMGQPKFEWVVPKMDIV